MNEDTVNQLTDVWGALDGLAGFATRQNEITELQLLRDKQIQGQIKVLHKEVTILAAFILLLAIAVTLLLWEVFVL